MKKLVSVWVDSEQIAKIKEKTPVSEFIRAAIDKGLQTTAYERGSGADINMCIFYLQNNIALSYADYVSLLSALDSFNDIDIITDEDSRLFAIVVAKILQIQYSKSMDISKGEVSYFTDYLIVTDDDIYDGQKKTKIFEAKTNCDGFETYVSYLIFGLKVKKFMPLGLVRALEVCMRDKILIENQSQVVKLCISLNDLFLKLAKHVVTKSPANYGFPYPSVLKEE